MYRILVGLMWVFHWLPFPVVVFVGNILGKFLYYVIIRRRAVVDVNLSIAFPHWSQAKRAQVAKEHFCWLSRSFFERGVLWWDNADSIRRLVKIKGLENLPKEGPALIAATHFTGLDAAWTRLSLERDMVAIYSGQRDTWLEKFIYERRRRFGKQWGVPRQGNIRPIVRALRSQAIVYLLPDLDLGRNNSVFVDFFGVPTATVTALTDYARLGQAKVIPCVVRMLPGVQGYEVVLFPAWKNFPGADEKADARRLNKFIEEQIMTMVAQYYWVHKRFKTRPEGQLSYYAPVQQECKDVSRSS